MFESLEECTDADAVALAKLTCGFNSGTNPTDETLKHLQGSILAFGKKALHYFEAEFDTDSQMFAAFVARATLENGVAAILGRIDPFRLLYLRNYQQAATFEYGRAQKTGFRWQGDVLATEKPPNDLWSPDHDVSKVSRALLSDYSDALFWQPAITKTLDDMVNASISPPTFLASLEVENVIPSFRTRFATLYSTLSKGVHWEFFIDRIVIDEPTLKDALRDTLLYLGLLGLFANYVPSVHATLPPGEALQNFETLRAKLS